MTFKVVNRLQCITVHYSALKYITVHYSAFKCILQWTPVNCRTPQCAPPEPSVQHSALCCEVLLYCTAVHCIPPVRMGASSTTFAIDIMQVHKSIPPITPLHCIAVYCIPTVWMGASSCALCNAHYAINSLHCSTLYPCPVRMGRVVYLYLYLYLCECICVSHCTALQCIVSLLCRWAQVIQHSSTTPLYYTAVHMLQVILYIALHCIPLARLLLCSILLHCTALHCIPPVRMGAAPWRPVSYPLQECSPSTSVFSKNTFGINREMCLKISTFDKTFRGQSTAALQHLFSPKIHLE